MKKGGIPGREGSTRGASLSLQARRRQMDGLEESTMQARARALVVCAAAVVAALAKPVAAEQSAQAEAQIRATLTRWLSDFNAGKASNVCGLFAIDLRADVRGQPERGYAALCDLLERSLHDPERAYSYALTIKEIVAWGDTAVVRLVWTLTMRQRGRPGQEQSVEPGMDVLRRQTDGSWKIVRFMAYAE
jgi:ketosteroid isomerase-like protein